METPNDPLKIAVYEWRVPYGLVWKHCFMRCSDLHASNCGMLETCFLCCDSTFFYLHGGISFQIVCILAGVQFIFDMMCLLSLVLPALAVISWNAPWYCMHILHGKCNLLDYHFYKCHIFKTGLVLQWSSVWQHKGCWCDVLWSHSGLSLSTDVPKNVPLFYYYTGKKDHTQSWCFVLCVSISLF